MSCFPFKITFNGMDVTNTGPSKLDKSVILEKVVEYILYLQNNQILDEMDYSAQNEGCKTLKTEC